MQPPLRRHQPHEGGNRIRRLDHGGRPLAGLRLGRPPVLRLRLFRPTLRLGREDGPGRTGLRLRPHGRRGPPTPRHAHHPRPQQPPPRPHGRRKPRPFPPHEGRRVPRRLADLAGQDRHGLAQPQHARPGHVPHPPRHAPSHGRQVVHLSHLRLHPRPERLAGRHHAFHLHLGIREPPPALRLVHQDAGHLPFAADGVRPLEPYLHDDEQAAAAGAGEAGDRPGLGRPAHAHDLRLPPAGLHARGHSQLLRGSAWPRSTA